MPSSPAHHSGNIPLPSIPDTCLTQKSLPSDLEVRSCRSRHPPDPEVIVLRLGGQPPPTRSCRSAVCHTDLGLLEWPPHNNSVCAVITDGCCVARGDSAQGLISLIRVQSLGCRHYCLGSSLVSIAVPKGRGIHVPTGEVSSCGYLEMCNKGSCQWRQPETLLGHIFSPLTQGEREKG